jgi:ankyrin repeat protein
MKTLIDANVNIDMKDNAGQSSLDHAIYNNQNLSIDLLLAHGIYLSI